MGRRGPKPVPAALKRAAGTRRDRVNEREPHPDQPSGPPVAPAHLDPVARELWERLAPQLHRHGVLTSWDLELLSRYCELESIAREALVLLQQFGTVIHGRRDRFVANPYWRIYRDAIDRQRALGHEFGLTPSGRSGLRIGEPEAS
jgi:P27 family predicted phage terminase small subunit